MTRKDHELIACAVRTAFEDASARYDPGATRQAVVDRLCTTLAGDNGSFRADRFRRLCMPRHLNSGTPPLSMPYRLAA